MFDYAAYAVPLRRELHQYPEIGFDLPRTLALVRRELEAMGIPYTEEFGRSGIVATINEGKPFTIGIRADMDALPITEATGLPFSSLIEGQMHACGHDVHTAQLLAVGRKLNDMRDQLRCCVKLIFTPAEEYLTAGARLMVEDGLMENIDCAVACHVDSTLPVGAIAIREGGINANSMGIEIEFFGQTAHAHSQQKGVDAIRMGVQAWTAMELMLAREIDSRAAAVLNVGSFHGGNTNNIVCDYVKMFLTTRTHSDELTDFMERRIREICEGTAQMCGGETKVTVTKLLPYVINHPTMTKALARSAASVLGEDNVREQYRSMGGEDFAFLSRKKPCAMFRLGVGHGPGVHNDKFNPDEGCFETGIAVFTQFVLDHQDGIRFEE
ncbi:MAG: amidohydrolase [Oscillospiraceae bacterium]|nr:amidohydrolase [Oscillospiraceae bacterium]